jgi:hypothetical protein
MQGKSIDTAQGAAVQRAAAADKPAVDSEPLSMYWQSSGTVQGAAVPRATAGDEPRGIYGESSVTA